VSDRENAAIILSLRLYMTFLPEEEVMANKHLQNIWEIATGDDRATKAILKAMETK